MPKKFTTNPKAAAAKEREQEKKQTEKQRKQKKAEDEQWKETDKHVLAKLERQKQKEREEEQKRQRQEENRLLYEKERASIQSNKEYHGAITKQQLKEERQKILEKQLEKVQLSDSSDEGERDEEEGERHLEREHEQEQEEEHDQQFKQIEKIQTNMEQLYEEDEEDFDKTIGQNLNHLRREQRQRDLERFNQIIDCDGVEDALEALEAGGQQMKTKEYVRKHFPIVKKQNPNLRRSQIMELVFKNWRQDPQNPRNQAAQ